MNERKFLEPEYGEIAPEVELLVPEAIDLDNIDRWRVQACLTNVVRYLGGMMTCNCYPKLMEVGFKRVTINHDGVDVRASLYLPVGDGPHPVVVFAHGGSFMFNDQIVYDMLTRYLSRFGNAVVIGVDYRLAPETKFPEPLEDVYAAVEWAAAHMSDFDGDPDNLIVSGESSGGNMAAAVSLMARDRKGPKIAKQMLIYPVADCRTEKRYGSEIRYGHGYFLEWDSTTAPMGPYFNSPDDYGSPYASPTAAEDLSGLPDSYFVSAECDPLFDQGLVFAAKLEDAGNSVKYHIAKGMLHGFILGTYRATFESLDFFCENM